MKRYFLTFLALIFVFLSACSGSNVPATKTDEAPADENKTENNQFYNDKIKTLFDKDFGGANFRIATDSSDLIVSPNAQSLIGKELYLRNRAVEEKYNVKITLTDESGLPTITDRIKTEALAGTDYCDLVILKSDQFQTLAASDALINVRSIPYLNLDQDYYDQNALKATTQGSYSYGFAGDFTFHPDNCFAVFFNKELLKQTSLPDIYKLVELNQWDTENFLLYAEEVFTLGRVNGVKVSGFLSEKSKEDLVNVFWAATGFDFLVNEYGERPELVFDHNDTQRFIYMMKNLLFSSTSYNTRQQNATESFAAGESLFFIAPLSSAKKLVGQNANWGVVPIPKLDINQTGYYSYHDLSYCLAGFSKGTIDLNKSGLVTSALFCASKGLNQKLAIQSYLNQYLSSPEDAKMMSKIIEAPYYDPVEFFGQIDSSYTAATQTILHRTISSEGDFTKLYNQYLKMLNKYLDSKM